jgi:hypothetical protein
MGKVVGEMTHEDWGKILIYLMRANELKARLDREDTTSIELNDPYIIEFKESAENISADTWFKLGLVMGKEL